MEWGIEQSIEKGLMQGKAEGKMEIARNMLLLKMNLNRMNLDVIQKATGLYSKEISKLVH